MRVTRRVASVALLSCLLVGCGSSAAPRPATSPPPPWLRGTPAAPPTVQVRAAGGAPVVGQLIGYDWYGPSGRQRREPQPPSEPAASALSVGATEPVTLDLASTVWPTAVELRWFDDVPSDAVSPLETEICRTDQTGACRFAATADATTITVQRTPSTGGRPRWLVVWASWYIGTPTQTPAQEDADAAGENFAVWSVPVRVAS